MIIGCVPMFEEAEHIGGCVKSLFAAGCERVVCLDGAYQRSDGKTFLNGGYRSNDDSIEIAESAGAEVIVPDRNPRFGEKRNMLLALCGADSADHVLFLDADERAVGRLNPKTMPSGHACVMLRNLKKNDLPDVRGEWPRGDAGSAVPLLRLLRWSPTLRLASIGQWEEDGKPLHAYLVNAFAERVNENDDSLMRQALAALREGEHALSPMLACALPIAYGFEIHHVAGASAEERVLAKRDFYGP